MKKYDFFLPSRPPFLQDFCKKAQWRAKKLRERGSSTARPTEKGVGGLPIGSRFGRFGASRPVDFVAICGLPLGVSSWLGRFGRFRRVGRVAIRSIWSAACVASCRFRRDLRTSSWRFVLIGSIRSIRSMPKSRREHKKSPIPSIGNRAVWLLGVARS